MRLSVVGPWVVYRVTRVGHPGGANAVCETAEWDALEAARPGLHTLVRGGIGSEAEAERLARGTAGDRAARPKPWSAPGGGRRRILTPGRPA